MFVFTQKKERITSGENKPHKTTPPFICQVYAITQDTYNSNSRSRHETQTKSRRKEFTPPKNKQNPVQNKQNPCNFPLNSLF